MASVLPAAELKEYMDKMTMEADTIHDILMDIAIYSQGSITYKDLLLMPMKRVKQFQDRLQSKINSKSNSNKMKAGEVNRMPATPESRQEIR